MILCRNCKHVTVDWHCDAVKLQSPVDGITQPVRCMDARAKDAQCGTEGKLFEPSQEFAPPEAA